MPVCIVALVGGNVATTVSGTTLNKKYDKNNKAQQWTVEREGDTKLAFKSELNGQYLRATVGSAYGLITTGEKQWWIAKPGVAPNSLWLKSADFPNAYLANASAGMADGNKVYVWPDEQRWWHALQWYLLDSAGNGISIPGTSGSGQDAQQTATAAAELKERENALAEREQAAKAKEAELAKRETEIPQDKAVSNDTEGTSKAKEVELSNLQKKMQEKEQALKDLEAKVQARQTQTTQSGPPTDDEQRLDKDTAEGDTKGGKMSQENERLKKELEQTKAALERAKGSGSQRWSGNAVHAPERKVPSTVRPSRQLRTNVRPAQNLPAGFNWTLAKRATGPNERLAEIPASRAVELPSPRVVEIES